MAPGRRAGEIESLAGLYLPAAGIYTLEVVGTRDSVQLYQLNISYSAAIDEPPVQLAALLIFIIPLLKFHLLRAIS